jgi:FAD/FMN-containing dehydrogenase
LPDSLKVFAGRLSGGGGHNGPGLGSVNDGLVIDLSTMNGVRVDPKQKTVRVGPGCTTGDVDHATQSFGQAAPFGIISTTGVAGLTLSGGHGYLSRQYGLAVDSLLEADVVLADGSFVTTSETENADLFWANVVDRDRRRAVAPWAQRGMRRPSTTVRARAPTSAIGWKLHR